MKDTYNMISVDGDTSTNDTVLASGKRHGRKCRDHREDSADYEEFCEGTYIMSTRPLAKKMAGDGEGATASV